MPQVATEKKRKTRSRADAKIEDLCQVVLFNDDVNSMEHVVGCLVKVFNHSVQLATKIMLEAHEKGRAIAEVEAESQAVLHKQQLESFGLAAAVVKL